MRERDVEKAWRKKINAEGGLCLKWVSPGCTGVPDRIVIQQGGEIYFIEFKSPNGKLTTRQEKIRNKLLAMGARVEVISALPE